MSVKIFNNYMDEKSKASKFVSFLIKISFLPISIEDDVIKFKITKAVVHILVYPGLCITNFLFVTFYFKNWMSNILIPNGLVDSVAKFMFILFVSGKT